MSSTAVGLLVAGLLLVEVAVATRFVRRHAIATDAAITNEECLRAADNAAGFLTGLTRSQRRQVLRSVRNGRAVSDPAVAPAATAAAYAAWLELRMSVARPRWITGLLGVFWGYVSASRLVEERGSFWDAINVAVIVACVWLVYETVVGPIRRSERAASAERLNLALVAGTKMRG